MTHKYRLLTEFYKNHFSKVYTFFFYKTRQNREIAEDLTQQTFLKVFEKLEQFDHARDFSKWFWTIARNTWIDFYRQQKNKDECLLIEEIEHLENLELALNEQCEMNFQLEKIKIALSELPETKRDLILLHYLADISISDLAQMYQTTENNIRVQISRILNKLSHNLALYGKS